MLSDKKPAVPAVQPHLYYTGFQANPSSCCLIEVDALASRPLLIVGTLKGTLETCFAEKGAVPKLQFAHKSESQINAIVVISMNPKITIFAQFRGEEILFFDVIIKGEDVELLKTKSYGITHFGFCKTLWDSDERRMIVPGRVDDCEAITLVYENSGEKVISLGADFLFSSYLKRYSSTDLSVNDCFKGAISSITQIQETINFDQRDRLLIAFEDATLITYDIRTKEVVALFKAPAKFSELIALSVHKDVDKVLWRIAITVCSRIFEVTYENESFELTKRIKKTGFAGVNCSLITFNASGDILICGYSSGRIEFFNVPEYELFKVSNFHDMSLLCLNTFRLHGSDEEMLFAGDEGGKLSHMNMKKLAL